MPETPHDFRSAKNHFNKDDSFVEEISNVLLRTAGYPGVIVTPPLAEIFATYAADLFLDVF